MATTARATASAAHFIDAKLQIAANAVDRFAGIVTATTANPDSGLGHRVGDPISRRLQKTAAQLRSQNGDAIIGGLKTQMLRNPKATVSLAAAVGAIAAQAALMMLKSEQPKKSDIKPVMAADTQSTQKKKRNPKKAAL